MLQAIRNNAQGIFVWVIVGLIIISFALFGLGSYLSGASKVVAASVNGVEISSSQLTRAYQDYQERLRQMFGDAYRPDMLPVATMKRQVLSQLVTEEVLKQMFQQQGYQASTEQVLARLKTYQAFQDDGKFSPQRYKQVLSVQGISSDEFEYGIVRDIAAQQLQSGISKTAFLTVNEKQRLADLINQKRKAGYFDISTDLFTNSVNVSDNEIEQFYKKNSARFMTEEKVQLAYLELNLDDIAKTESVSEEKIKQHYESSPENYMAADEAGAKKKIDSLRKQVLNGADFAELAKKYSQDKGSAANGGDLGYVTRGISDEFDKIVFSMKKGDISPVIKSKQGYQIVQLEDIRNGDPEERKVRHILIKAERKLQPLRKVHDAIRKELQYQQASNRFFKDMDELNNLSYENPDSLEPVADALGLKIKTSDFVTRRGGKGILANSKVLSAAFSDEVLKQGRNSELVELSDSHVLVLRVKKHQPAAVRPLNEVKQQIVAALKAEKASGKADEVARDILERLNKGETIDNIKASYTTVKWNQPGWIKRQPDKKSLVPAPVRQYVFSMAKPQADKVTWNRTRLPSGGQVVIGLFAVDIDKAAPFNARQFVQALGNADFNAYLDFLKSQADISINEEVLNADNETL